MTKASYDRQYYLRTIERRRYLARTREVTRRWCTWLIGELVPSRRPVEPPRAKTPEMCGPLRILDDALHAALHRSGFVHPESGCWITHKSHAHGYAFISLNNKLHAIHRISFRCYRGEIPAGELVCHACDNPLCWNPHHLFIGSHKENTADAIRKGRLRRPLSKYVESIERREREYAEAMST